MKAKEYQQLAAKYLIENQEHAYSSDETLIVWNALGLAGEAGEVANLVKKGVFHRHGLDKSSLKKELGDVLWYATTLCTYLGLDLGEVMKANIDKLQLRYPAGFTFSDSKKRADLDH